MKARFVGFMVLAMALLLTGCNGSDQGKPDKKKKTTAIPVEAARVEQRDISARYQGIATLEADRRTDVVAQVGGIVEQVLAEEGDRVAAGDALAQLDDARYKLELERAQATLEKLRQNLQREKRLHDRKLGSTQQYEGLVHDLEVQQAQVALARLNLEYTRIRAPFAGVIDSREARVGMLVNPGQKLFGLYDPESLQARVYVPERELALLSTGLAASLTVDAWPGERFAGAVARISPVVDASSGTVAVTVAVRSDERLKPGMFTRLDIPYDTHAQAVVMPEQALVERDGQTGVWRIDADSQVHWQPVQTGYREQGWVEVLDGLAVGDRLVTLGRHSLKEGAQVQVIDPLAETAEGKTEKKTAESGKGQAGE